MAEWSEDLHPRDHGKFSASEGAQGVTDEHRAKAAESLKDSAFLQAHYARLGRAADEAKAKFAANDLGPNGRHGDAAHAAGQSAIHEELARIHAEHDAHGGDEHLKEVADAARAHAGVHDPGAGSSGQHAAALAAISSAKEESAAELRIRDSEDRAIASGHITSEARDVVDAYAAQQTAHAQAADEHVGALHEAHSRALDALGALNSHTHEEITNADGEMVAHGHSLELEHAHPDSLAEEFSATHSSLAERSLVHGEHNYDEHERHGMVEAPEAPGSNAEDSPHPDKSDHWKEATPHPDDPDLGEEFRPKTPAEHAAMLAAHHAEYAARLAAHEQQKADETEFHAKLAEHHAEFRRRAETAQSALEDLHAKQVAAHAALKEITAKSERAHATARGQLDKMGDDHHVNENAVDESTSAAAHEASRTFVEHQSRRLDELGSHDFGDGLGSLHTEMKSTSAAIKELSKHTGRAPKLAGKTKKGLKRRQRRIYTSPDRGAAALAASY